MPQQQPIEETISDLVAANRILAMEAILDDFGHVSIRDPSDPNCYLMSRSVSPALVTSGDIIQHDLDNNAAQEKDRGQKLYTSAGFMAKCTKRAPTSMRSSTAIRRQWCRLRQPRRRCVLSFTTLRFSDSALRCSKFAILFRTPI